MANPFQLIVKESIKELQSLQRKHGELIGLRLQILIEYKRAENGCLSKRELSTISGINHNTILKWRKIYKKEGLDPLLKHGRKGFKKSIITKEEHDMLSVLLHNPKNGINGYTELQEWIRQELSKDMKYITIVKYVQNKFSTKLKVARKSHILKDEKAVDLFKKTLGRNV